MSMSPRLLRPRATGFNPKSISGLAAWYDASVASSITLNGSTVSQWNDLSGNDRHQAQATAALQPNYNASGLNGKGTLTTTGTQWMQASAFPVSLSGDYTIFLVMKFDLLSGLPFAFQRGAGNEVHSLLTSGGSANFVARRGSGNEATISGEVASSIQLSKWYLITIVFKTTLSRIFVGSRQGTDNTSTLAAATGNKVLTLFAYDATFQAGRPGFAEFIYYNAELDSTQQSSVRSYLSKKWGVAL